MVVKIISRFLCLLTRWPDEVAATSAAHPLATDTQLGQRRLLVLILQVTVTVSRGASENFQQNWNSEM